VSLSLLSALEQLARYAREEGIPDHDIYKAVSAPCSHGHGGLKVRVRCGACECAQKAATYIRAA
jgi:hypothetical protein